MPKMRFAKQCAEELRKEDKNSQVSVYYIRRLVKMNLVPSVDVGSGRRLINYDALVRYLATGKAENAETVPEIAPFSLYHNKAR